MSRLIDADLLEVTSITTDDYSGNEELDVVLKEDIDDAPTVKAIPIEKLEQIKEEIGHAMDMEPAWKGQDNYVGGLEIAMSIIDKAIKEVEQ